MPPARPTRPSRRSAELVALVVLAAVLVGTGIGASIALLAFPSEVNPGPPEATVRLPSPSAAISPTPSRPARPTRDVPPTIDATGVTDVTEDLQAFIESVPDGTTIRFAPGGLYRVEGTIFVESRTDLELDGAGATIASTEAVDFNRRNISLVESSWIRIHDLTIRGASTTPGVLDRDRAFEHGIWIDGGSDIEIHDVTLENNPGDCIYLGVGDSFLPWPERVHIHDNVCRGPGRNGIAIIGGRDVLIERNTIERTGLHAIDIEPNRTDGRDGTEEVRPVQGARNVAVIANRIVGPIEGYFFAANGWGAIDDVTVVGNVLEGTPLRITVQPLADSGFIRTGVRIEGNRSDTPYETIDGAAMRFRRVTDLTVRDNTGPLSGEGGVLIEIQDTCRVSIGDNKFPGGQQEVLGTAGACPVATAPQQPTPMP